MVKGGDSAGAASAPWINPEVAKTATPRVRIGNLNTVILIRIEIRKFSGAAWPRVT
jgi:hypothetical protein